MNTPLTNKDLLGYLKSINLNAGFIDRLKVNYRPLVCPFVDLINVVKPGDKVADVGCGSGQFCLLLSHFAKPREIYGTEISGKLIAHAKELFKSYSTTISNFEVFNGAIFPSKLAEMDLIFLIDVLHHVPKEAQRQFVSDLVSTMKPGAKLIIKDIDRGSPLVYFNKVHDLVFAKEVGHEVKFNDMITWLTSLNTKIIASNKKRMYVYPHYTIIAEKP